ncbi:MAG: hypothetical protein JO356_00290 [Acidobacteria bacterium]|nr:hypothetical protein [Acidobacteriota bacterium]
MGNDEICSRFNKVLWHDSKLCSFAVVREGDRDDIVFNLELRGMPGLELTPAILTLIDATYLKAEVDLDGKHQCADDISSAHCHARSALRDELLRSQFQHSPTALDGYYHFNLYLIPPGGRIDVFARNFELNGK